MAERFFGILRHQPLELGLRSFVLEKCAARRAEDGREPSVARR
jgi:hypothetical protein